MRADPVPPADEPSVRAALRLPPDLVTAADLARVDPRSTPVGPQDKAAGRAALADLTPRLDDAQEALFAEAAGGGRRAVLLVLQGMDTSGKGGVVRHVAGVFNPHGLTVAAFGAPTAEELAHDFLWRIRPRLPAPGRIGVFDRSHYEDVLIARVESLVDADEWRSRYGRIRAFEDELVAAGTTVVKCLLHLSPQEQADRLLARLDDPRKRWKFHADDLRSRARWADYQHAYVDALRATDSDTTPWYVVPADRKWYRNWAVAALLAETLTELDPQYPPATVDVDAARARLATMSV